MNVHPSGHWGPRSPGVISKLQHCVLFLIAIHHANQNGPHTFRYLDQNILALYMRQTCAGDANSIHCFHHIISFHKLLLKTPRPAHFIRTAAACPLFTLSENTTGRTRCGHDEWAQMRHACLCILAEVADWIEILYLQVSITPTHDSSDITFPRLTELESYDFLLPSSRFVAGI